MASPDRYGTTAAAFHWAGAALILGALGTGFAAAQTTDPAAKAALLRLHLPLGLAILVLTLARLAWALREARRGTRPAPLLMAAWRRRGSAAVHALLYIVPLGMAATGIGLAALSAAGPVVFGGGTLPDFWAFPPRIPHGIGARLLVLLLVLHVAAALHHALPVKSNLLGRMWPAPRRAG